MIRLTLTILALMFFSLYTSRAHAEEMASAVEAFELPISKGHWKVGGSFWYMADGNNRLLQIAPEAEYFLVDHLSFGGAVEGTWGNGGYRYATVAPAFTYYFETNDHWAYFVRQSLGWSTSSYDDGSASGSTALGATYFFNKHVGFSPQIRAQYGRHQTGYVTASGAFNIFF